MTVAFNPNAHHDYPSSPVLGPLVDGDLCDIRVRRGGKWTYCHETALHAGTDVDGSLRLLCAQHTALYFPNAA